MSCLLALLLISSPLVFSTPFSGPHDTVQNRSTGLVTTLSAETFNDDSKEVEEAVFITYDPNVDGLEPLIRKMIKRESSDDRIRVHGDLSSLTRQEALSQGIWAELSAPKIHKRPIMRNGKRVAMMYWWVIVRQRTNFVPPPKVDSTTTPTTTTTTTENPLDNYSKKFFGNHRSSSMKRFGFPYPHF